MSAVLPQLIDPVPRVEEGCSLEKYRKKASFDIKKMKLALEPLEIQELKDKVWSTLRSNPVFRRRQEIVSSEEQKRDTGKQLVALLFTGLFDGIHSLSYRDRTKYLIIVNEAIEAYDPNLSIKFALGISLFSNALLCLGTERHLSFHRDVWTGKMLSCLAITELGHGSDTKKLQTTATYDPSSQEFVVNTPCLKATKVWAGNLGKQCTHALVFAQLICDGINHGLHGFVVPIRDPQTLLPYMNLVVGDMGEKAGLNGIDNGYLIFHNYRIPKDNLLNRTADINEEGEYETTFSDPGKILAAALETLSAGRVAIMRESSTALAKAAVIAVRYAAQRSQFSDSNGDETPIIEYQTHQWRLFPYLAAAYAMKLFSEKFSDEFVDCVALSQNGQMDVDQTSQMVSGVHAIVCCSKSLITWTSQEAIQTCREACGGYGYLRSAGFGDLRNNHDPRVTFEGDNTVLLQQTVNWLLKLRDMEDFSFFPLTCVKYLASPQEVLGRTFNPAHFEDGYSNLHSFISSTYEWLVSWLLRSTSQRMEALSLSTGDKFKARSSSQVFKARSLSLAFAESSILSYFWEFSSSCEPELRSVTQTMYYLYGLWSLHKHIGILYQGGFSTSPLLAELISETMLRLCADLKPNAVALADAISPPDFILQSILGTSDGKVYEKIMEQFQGSFEKRPYWWSEVQLKPKL